MPKGIGYKGSNKKPKPARKGGKKKGGKKRNGIYGSYFH